MSDNETQYLASKALEGIDALSAQITQVAPVIWGKMVLLTQAESIAYLAVGAICLAVALIATYFFNKIKSINSYDWPVSKGISLGFMLAYVPAAINLCYPWNWVGAFAPEARLIARLIGAITGTSS